MLKKYLRSYPAWILLGLIVLGFSLRISGLNWGFYSGDEHFIDRIIGQMAFGHLAPDKWDYPPFFYYLCLAFRRSIALIRLQLVLPWLGNGILANRVLHVGFGTLTIPLIYLAGKKLFNQKTGLAAATLLTFSFYHVMFSHVAKVDIPAAFFSLLSFYFIIDVYRRGRLRDYLISGLLIGLTTATSYNGGLLLLPLLLAHLFRDGQTWPAKLRSGWLLLTGVLFVPLGFLLASPFSLINWPDFWSQFSHFSEIKMTASPWVADGYYQQLDLIGRLKFNNWIWYLDIWREGLGWLAFLTLLASVFWTALRSDKKLWLVLSYPFVYWLMLGRGIEAHDNYIVIVLPLAYLAVAACLESLSQTAGRRATSVLIGLLLLVNLGPAYDSWETVRSYLREDTRKTGGRWINENLPAGSRIGLGPYSVSGLDGARFSIVRLYDWPIRRDTAPTSGYPQRLGLDYLVTSSWFYGRFTDYFLEDYFADWGRYYDSLREPDFKLLREFSCRPVKSHNPTIRVYQVIQPAGSLPAPAPR